jgi:hypothetical protein
MDTPLLVFIPPGRALTLQGSGIGVTHLITPLTDTPWISVGQVGSPRIGNVTFREMTVSATRRPTAGAAFLLRNCKSVSFEKLELKGAYTAFVLGDASERDSAYGIYLKGVQVIPKAGGGGPAVELASCSGVFVDSACLFNGDGNSILFSQTNPRYNTDGLFCEMLNAQQWSRHIHVTGAGISNLQINGGLIDRPKDCHIYAAPSHGGHCKEWVIRGLTLEGIHGKNHLRGIHLTQEAGGRVYGVQISDLSAFDLGREAIFVDDDISGIGVNQLNARDCGFNGTPIVRVGPGMWTVSNVQGSVLSSPGYTYVLSIDGPSTPDQRAYSNIVGKGYTQGLVRGTA